tara:strand:+ start:458 stop:1630 length:1173 start_codon:yes stop_codon:yes gene_type:complete
MAENVSFPDQFRQATSKVEGLLKKSFNKAESAAQNVTNRTSGGAFRYPVDESYPVYMHYRVREVIPPLRNATDQVNELYQAHVDSELKPVRGVSSSGYDALPSASAVNKAKETAYQKKLQRLSSELQAKADRAKFQKRSGAKEGLLGFKTAYLENPIDIKLYMPPGVMFHDNVQYDQAQLGLSGAAGLQAFNDTGSGMSAIGSMLSETAASLTGLFSGGGNLDTARVAMARGVQAYSSLLTSGQQAAFNLGLQVTVNPNTRSVFQGVSVRNFSFQYDFYPTSKTEQNQVERIIKTFRTQMYPRAIPEASLQAGFPLGYKFPNLFEINFKFNNAEIQGMPRPLFCFLRDVSTTFNPGGMSYHDQGKPTHMNMSLQFQEFRALNQQDIENGH